MNIIDKNFMELVNEIKSLDEKEMYYRIRKNFDNVPDEIKINCANFFNQFNYWGILDMNNNNYEEIRLKQEELYNHINDFAWLYGHLKDYRSKKTLYSILNNWYRYDFKTTSETKEYMFDDYFDLDLVKCSNDEVIVDLGAYTGDTIVSYIKNYGINSYKKIYCYEITEDTFKELENNLKDYENIDLRLKGVSDEEGYMSVSNNSQSYSANTLTTDGEKNVEITTLDLDINEPISMIIADIEGFEKKAIEGAKNHIKNDHPKLLISVYHSNEDLWKIPKMIYEINNDYNFYLRYNSSPLYPTEITLIAI